MRRRSSTIQALLSGYLSRLRRDSVGADFHCLVSRPSCQGLPCQGLPCQDANRFWQDLRKNRGVSLHLHVYIHLCTYMVYTCILEAYTVYCTDYMLSK